MAAYECGTTDFPEPPYPDSIICPEAAAGHNKTQLITFWTIMAKVRVEAFCWGAGTALGELPPYFMARASRLSGYDPDEEEDEFEELQEKRAHPENMVGSSYLTEVKIIIAKYETKLFVFQNWFDRAKLGIEKIVERIGFFGILACASVSHYSSVKKMNC